MPTDYGNNVNKEIPPSRDYESNPLWQRKPLTPAQLLVHDVRLETFRPGREPVLEINERFWSSLVPGAATSPTAASSVRIDQASANPIERQQFSNLEDDYGWIRNLRLQEYQKTAHDSVESAKCRWIHCSSKFPDYMRGFLWALSNDVDSVAQSMSLLDQAIARQTRYSKHGRYFAPFSQVLRPHTDRDTPSGYPLLVSVPFLDWGVSGPTPPLRFQIDRREGFRSTRSSSHILRSILQYYYRLEDTKDRESSQVFARHKPWRTSRELDLKVRQWYGHYPSSLNVDELWILAIDAQHIVTLSSNQTWKSRWPPLQLSSRILDISFRSLRNTFFRSYDKREYTALTHTVASLAGAVGLLHRNFWPDVVLCLADRYAGHLGHLQYRLHRSPSTKLVMDLIACQEELNIVIQITEQQIDMINDLQSKLEVFDSPADVTGASPISDRPHSAAHRDHGHFDASLSTRYATYRRQLSTSTLPDPVAQVIDNLERELNDLRELRDNADRLVTRTIQLVNIRLEDHGKAILVFTVVTIIFLPLNFVSSFFGMNVSDIRLLEQSQWLFWAVALSVTTFVLALSIFLAFSGGAILEKLLTWRDVQRENRLSTVTGLRQNSAPEGPGFRVHGMDEDNELNYN